MIILKEDHIDKENRLDAFLLTSDMTGITFAFASNETKNLKFIAMNWLDILLDSDKFDYDYEKQEIVLNNYLNKNDVQLFQTEDGTLYHPIDDYGDENENIWVIDGTNGNETKLNIVGSHHERF